MHGRSWAGSTPIHGYSRYFSPEIAQLSGAAVQAD
jgi:hypothetical protein